MPGASPFADDLDAVRRLEDAGAGAIVMHSLFEEQIALERPAGAPRAEAPATPDYPGPEAFPLDPEGYLNRIRLIKETVGIPVFASLNGTTPAWWLEYARLIEEAGADALELNIYFLAADPLESSDSVDRRIVETARDVKNSVKIPVAVKLSPYFSCLAGLAQKLDVLGLDGLILFNRFYQPDIDLERLEVSPVLDLSHREELRLRLRWVAILSGQIRASLAVSGGVHTAEDAIKALLTGADAVQMVSTLLRHGPERLKEIHDGVRRWMEENGHQTLEPVRGRLNYQKYPDPAAFERANYVRLLQGRKISDPSSS